MYYSDDKYKNIPVPKEYQKKYDEFNDYLEIDCIESNTIGNKIFRKAKWIIREDLYQDFLQLKED